LNSQEIKAAMTSMKAHAMVQAQGAAQSTCFKEAAVDSAFMISGAIEKR